MTIKIDKDIPIREPGRPVLKKYEEYYDTVDIMEHGDSFAVDSMRTAQAMREYSYTNRFRLKNKDAKILTKQMSSNEYRVWKIFES